ncbi:MAG: FmdB family zinc ribbon protein [Candidatus Marinimicrobia bacterium]|nr:FmdB family zinc ribbon protein [Candidatus Neomarinimicrobiota bacterium]
MPKYTYRCEKCDYEFDEFQSFSDKPITICPKCKGKVKKLILGGGVVFKGSGFYVNDYKKKTKNDKKTINSQSKNSSKTKKLQKKKRENK